MTQKMVDGEYLSRLIDSSFEELIRRADGLVEQNAELFGGGDGVLLQSWTFPQHVIVANSEGEFFRASFGVSEDTGETTFGEVETVNVPVKEARELAQEARESANTAVDAILSGDPDKALQAVASLQTLVQSGVRLTAEGVEDALGAIDIADTPWFASVQENESSMRVFVGAEGSRAVPQPRFAGIEESSGEMFQRNVRSSLNTLRTNLTEMFNGMALAREIGENHVLTAAKSDADPSMSTLDFMEFVEAFDGDLCRVKGVVEDALSVVEDGNLSSLTRVYDGVAERMYEMNLAAVFCEKLARRFDAPSAA